MEVRFDEPKWDGYLLDYCLRFEIDCGKPAADYWCYLKEYDSATDFQMRGPLPLRTFTKLPATGEFCDTAVHRCDTFNYITCIVKVV